MPTPSPTILYVFPTGTDKGMELRDFFAGMALQGMLQSGTIPSQLTDMDGANRANFNYAAYRMADLMLAQRGH